MEKTKREQERGFFHLTGHKENREKKFDKKNRKQNAWKRYGVIVMMAGVLIAGTSCVPASVYAGNVQAEEETEAETEKRVTLNIAGGKKDDASCRGSDRF